MMSPRVTVERVLVACAVGALVGAVVGGVGGRIAMLVLRLGSSDVVRGLDTDDGFEIGRFSTSTSFLIALTAGLGGVTALAYFVVRGVLPTRGRVLGWGGFVGVVSGADTLKPDSFDFSALDPKAFAVVAFVALPAVAAAIIAAAVDRLDRVGPRTRGRLAVIGAICLLPVFPLLFGVALVSVAALLVARSRRLGRVLREVGAWLVPAGLAALTVVLAVVLVRDAARIL